MKHNTQDFFDFPCGCKFPIISNEPMRLDLNLDIETIPLDCPRTWEMISRGDTKGCFQLESQLGQSWAKKLKPENIEELSALISIIRPGSLENIIGGKNVTQHYVDRKHHLEPVEYFHPSLEEILKPTQGLMIYQEQAMQIAQKVAGFNLSQADILRKAIGKKKPEVMAKVKIEFLNGCKKQKVVTQEEAEEIFGWIEKSQRYSFNKCLSPNVTVEKSNKQITTLEEIQIGDYVNTPEGYCEVVNKYDNGVQELFEITLEGGKNIQCTLEHQFLCEDGLKYQLWEILSQNLKIVCDDD